MATDKPLILVDGSSYLFRAYFALPPLTNSKGNPTGAIYGVLNMLKRLVKDYEPDYIGVVFDPKGPTFRKELYEDYKANRDEMPDELRVQIQPLFKAIKAMGFPLIIVDGVEADDVIGTLAIAAQAENKHVLISTGDKDIAQMVNDKVTLINTMNNKLLDVEGVQEKFGVLPEQIIDYLSLVGDTSDNVPGVPKVGPKTAVKWLKEYGSLDNIMQRADEFKGKVGENLRESLAHLPLTKKLVTIKCDVDVPMGPSELKPREPDQAALVELFADLEFKNWLAEYQSGDVVSEPAPSEKTYDTILTEAQFSQWLEKLKQADCFALDTETTALDAMKADLVGLSFAVKSGEAAYLPVAHDYLDAPEQLDKQWALSQLKPIFEDSNKIIVGQNLKYDLKILLNEGVDLQATLWDTMLESYVLHNTLHRHDMDTLAQKYLNHKTISFEEVAGKGAKQITFNQVALEQATPYAAEDADITLQLHQVFQKELQSRPDCDKVLREVELPLMPVLAQMEFIGVAIDEAMLQQQSATLQKAIQALQEEIFALAGEQFNIDSPKQLQHILFDKLNIPVIKKTPKGQPSTAENVMQELANDYPLPKLILSYRSLAKLKSTYTDKLPRQINPKTGRVHTHYNQTGTSTGRLSSSDPNLQNIPIRTQEGRRIREAFVARENYVLISADYSQVELRIMAHLSQDPGLVHAFEEGLDVHASTAAEVHGIAMDEVTSNQRRAAKAVNFGLMYGMSAFGLSQQLGIERQEAQKYIDAYFARYPKVLEYMEQARAKASEQGYVQTLFGRRLYVPEINSKNGLRRKAAERQAINAPLQGSVADIIKVAMIQIQQWIDETHIDISMLMQVHDELIFEVAEKDLIEAKAQIQRTMQEAATLSVPLIVDVGIGKNWDEAH